MNKELLAFYTLQLDIAAKALLTGRKVEKEMYKSLHWTQDEKDNDLTYDEDSLFAMMDPKQQKELMENVYKSNENLIDKVKFWLDAIADEKKMSEQDRRTSTQNFFDSLNIHESQTKGKL